MYKDCSLAGREMIIIRAAKAKSVNINQFVSVVLSVIPPHTDTGR